MINQKFIDRVEELKYHTKTSIDDIQNCCCPMVKDIYLNYQFEYWYDGYKYNIWEQNTHLYAINEIPYCYDNGKKNVIFQGNMIDLVNNDKVWPFLFFINGHVVPWSQITIIRDYDYSYIKINGESNPISDSAKIIYFPLASKEIRYGEDEDYSKDSSINGLYFDKDRKLIESPEFQELSVRLEFKSKIYFRLIRSTEYDEGYERSITFKDLETGYVPTLKNMIIFDNDGYLKDSSDKFPEYIKDTLNGTYTRFQIDHSFPTFNYLILQLYFYNSNKSLSYPYTKDIDKNKLEDQLIIGNESIFLKEDLKELKNMIISPFDFSFSRDNTYDQNIRSSMRTITRYDYSLWNKVFIDESPVKSYSYTGREFKKLSDLKSYVRYSRRHSELIEDVVMMFVNGTIYKHNIDISYTNNTINIPAFGILDEDVIELVVFTKCNNNILNIVVPDPQSKIYIHPEYSLDDCYIMDTQTALSKYPQTPESSEDRRQYICKILSKTKDENNMYNIQFEDPSHYGRKLKIVPKNQFRYYRFVQTEKNFKIVLPQQFNYCHDLDRYMIFVNGTKIDKTEYTITIMNEFRPFDKLVLYISTILDENDRVDIFYVPEYLVEKYKVNKIAFESGIIHLSTNYPKFYALSKHTSMVFVNGKKINPLDIQDVSMNNIIMDVKYDVVDNVTVIEYLSGSKEIAKYLYGIEGVLSIKGDTTYNEEYKTLKDVCGTILQTREDVQIAIEDTDYTKYLYDQWMYVMDTIIKYHTTGEKPNDSELIESIDKLYTFSMMEGRDDNNYKNDYAPLKSIIYDIIVDYYIQRSDMDTGKPFDYDFEIDLWNKDNMGNADITLYPDHDKLLDYNLDIEDVTPEKVLEDKKYRDV